MYIFQDGLTHFLKQRYLQNATRPFDSIANKNDVCLTKKWIFNINISMKIIESNRLYIIKNKINVKISRIDQNNKW